MIADLWERRARCEVGDQDGAPEGWECDGETWSRYLSNRVYLWVGREQSEWEWVVEGLGPVKENHMIDGVVKLHTGRVTYALDAMMEADEAAKSVPVAAYCAACDAWEALEAAIGRKVGGER